MKFEARKLVNEAKSVSAIGIGGGYGLPARAFEKALEQGINYFFYAPIFPTYRSEQKWLKESFKTQREKIVIGTCTYFWKIPGSLERTLNRHLEWLGTDYIDYFHLGMIREEDPRAIEQLLKFKEKKLIRHIAFSSHNRKLGAELIKRYPFELAMIRYNSAHRGAEKEFFPSVDSEKVSVVAFNATRHKSLLKAPRGWDKNKPIPNASDCYRFVLSHPGVTICLAGPSNEEHLNEIFSAIEKEPMSREEMNWMREFGDLVYKRS